MIYLHFVSPYLLLGFKHLDDDSHKVKHCFFQNTKLWGGRCGKTECRVFWSLVQCSASELCHSGGIIWPLWSGFLLGDISLMMIWLPHTQSHGENNAVENFESSVLLWKIMLLSLILNWGFFFFFFQSAEINGIETSLVVQWFRLPLPMQGPRVRSWVRDLRSYMAQGQKTQT